MTLIYSEGHTLSNSTVYNIVKLTDFSFAPTLVRHTGNIYCTFKTSALHQRLYVTLETYIVHLKLQLCTNACTSHWKHILYILNFSFAPTLVRHTGNIYCTFKTSALH